MFAVLLLVRTALGNLGVRADSDWTGTVNTVRSMSEEVRFLPDLRTDTDDTICSQSRQCRPKRDCRGMNEFAETKEMASGWRHLDAVERCGARAQRETFAGGEVQWHFESTTTTLRNCIAKRCDCFGFGPLEELSIEVGDKHWSKDGQTRVWRIVLPLRRMEECFFVDVLIFAESLPPPPCPVVFRHFLRWSSSVAYDSQMQCGRNGAKGRWMNLGDYVCHNGAGFPKSVRVWKGWTSWSTLAQRAITAQAGTIHLNEGAHSAARHKKKERATGVN